MKRLIMFVVVLFPVSCFVVGCNNANDSTAKKSEAAKIESDYAKEWTSRNVQSPPAATVDAEKKTQPEEPAATKPQTPETPAPEAEKKK